MTAVGAAGSAEGLGAGLLFFRNRQPSCWMDYHLEGNMVKDKGGNFEYCASDCVFIAGHGCVRSARRGLQQTQRDEICPRDGHPCRASLGSERNERPLLPRASEVHTQRGFGHSLRALDSARIYMERQIRTGR